MMGTRRARLHSLICFAAILSLLATSAAAQKNAPAKPVDLNSATIEQLRELPGIGPTRAKAILDFRERSGPFERVDDLLAIRGISRARLEKLRPYVVVVPVPPKSPPKPASKL
ncbi:MAG: ComEA family DNA-binding protein [Candidatus Acidiferrales bacterium]